MATAPSANDLTRQQLDELDDLLQRMLNLPLTGTEPPPVAPIAPTGPTWRYDAPAAPPAPTPHLVAPPEPPRAPVIAAPPLVAPPPPPVVRPEPVIAPVPLIPPPEPTTPIIERKPTPPSRPAPKPAPAPAAAAPAPAPQVVYEPQPPLPVLLWPLAGLNWVFDRVTGLLGPPGWLLRSGFGKNALGLAGVGLLVYTAAHLATDAGWVALPFPVPWPH